ncbi:uncharacterized protein F4817DRAFT_312766 [Daldinia loculata]|uniref:uncharacterized protein n=1 Tax=Daldinia loculata TaxID=103429 RepID=UPI0020C51581|nr:uncharacterized protein F4817DRAFT_312766 [Daldinia loculata]KAI1650398.1 hypothetical protein F4817DRAFT_312766 [Daldinia loculata]
MARQVAESGIKSMPTEIVVEIFTSMESAREVRSLFLASKRFYKVYVESSNHIAKALILRRLDPNDYKLAVMAIESRKVNPLDKSELKQFFNDYVHHREWDIKLFRMYTAFHLPELQDAAEHILESEYGLRIPELHDIIPETATEHARKIRALYLREILLNLFHQMPNRYKYTLTPFLESPPYPEWVIDFRANFCYGELIQVEAISNWPYRFLVALDKNHITLPKAQHGPGCKCFSNNGILNGQRVVHMGQQDPYKWMKLESFAKVVGIQKLYRWCCPTRTDIVPMRAEWSNFSYNSYPIISNPGHLRMYREAMYRTELLNHPRFHNDPESPIDKIWNKSHGPWYATDGIIWPHKDPTDKLLRIRVLSDYSSLEALRRLVHTNDPRIKSWGLRAI